jgi:predicted metalloprotease with PDZ domain
MKKIIFAISSLLSINIAIADGDYHYSVDLTKVNNDKLTIKLTPPDMTENETVFMFPAMVPGTYEVYDFGRFVSNFKAEGKDGKTITVEKININSYKLSPASAIKEITYEVEDTWDTNIKEKPVFEPGGSDIEEGKVFGINTHCFFGYFKNKIETNFILEFTKPKGFYASTSLTNLKSGETKDVISVFNYHDLVDAPILYCQPDTTTINIGDARVLISVYSPNKIQFCCSQFKRIIICSSRIFRWRITY